MVEHSILYKIYKSMYNSDVVQKRNLSRPTAYKSRTKMIPILFANLVHRFFFFFFLTTFFHFCYITNNNSTRQVTISKVQKPVRFLSEKIIS